MNLNQTENRSKIQGNGSGKEKKKSNKIQETIQSITFLTVKPKLEGKKTFFS